MAARLKRRSHLLATDEAKRKKRSPKDQQTRLHSNGEQDTTPQPADIYRLPGHVWLQVMEQLSLTDRGHMALTCRLFHQLFLDPSLWRFGCLQLDEVGWAEGGPPRLGLRRVDKTRAEKFGRHFQHLDLHVWSTQMEVESSSLELLSRLSHSWTLKSLTLSAPSFGMGDTTHLSFPANSALSATVQLVRAASSLHRLDLRRWPLTSDRLGSEHSGLGIERVLGEGDTCPRLRSLDITWQKGPVSSQTDNLVKRSPQTAVDLAAKFPHLQHLSLHHFQLSESLLKQLATNAVRHSPLQSLSLSVRLASDAQHSAAPRLSRAAWARLTAACPQLGLRLSVRSPRVQFVEWLLQPYIPVCSVRLHVLLAQLAVREMVARTQVWKDTLQSLQVDVQDQESFSLDEDLLVVASSCPRLTHLVLHGKVRTDTVSALASLPRKWTTFTFCEEDLQPGLNDEELSPLHDVMHHQRRRLLDTLCQSVSRDLGYQWRPSSRSFVTSLL